MDIRTQISYHKFETQSYSINMYKTNVMQETWDTQLQKQNVHSNNVSHSSCTKICTQVLGQIWETYRDRYVIWCMQWSDWQRYCYCYFVRVVRCVQWTNWLSYWYWYVVCHAVRALNWLADVLTLIWYLFLEERSELTIWATDIRMLCVCYRGHDTNWVDVLLIVICWVFVNYCVYSVRTGWATNNDVFCVSWCAVYYLDGLIVLMWFVSCCMQWTAWLS